MICKMLLSFNQGNGFRINTKTHFSIDVIYTTIKDNAIWKVALHCCVWFCNKNLEHDTWQWYNIINKTRQIIWRPLRDVSSRVLVIII